MSLLKDVLIKYHFFITLDIRLMSPFYFKIHTLICLLICSSSHSIEDLLKKWGLKGIQIPLERFNANDGNIGGSNLSDLHTIQMLEITRQ